MILVFDGGSSFEFVVSFLFRSCCHRLCVLGSRLLFSCGALSVFIVTAVFFLLRILFWVSGFLVLNEFSLLF